MIATKDLLTAQSRLKNEVIPHRILDEKAAEVHSIISAAPAGTVIILAGVAGVGVKRIARAVRDRCREDFRPFNPLAAVELTARAPTSSRFRWTTFYANGLAMLDEPILGQRRRATESPSGITEYFGSARFRGEEEYRTDFENALQRRECRTLSVVDAHFMLRRLPPEELHHPLQAFHQLANSRSKAPSVVLLSGSYELLKMIRNDSRVEHCIRVVEVPPYSLTDPKKDASEFTKLLLGFEVLLGQIMPAGLLTENNQVIAARTLGAAGWVQKALSGALAEIGKGDPRALTWKDIERHLPTNRARERLALELKSGLDWFADHPQEPGTASLDAPVRKTRTGSRRVGERNPSRDPVGTP